MQFLTCGTIVIKDLVKNQYDCINPQVIEYIPPPIINNEIDTTFLFELCSIGFMYVAGLLIMPVIVRHAFSEILKIFDKY